MAYQPPFNPTNKIGNLAMEIAEMVGALIPSSSLNTNPQLHRRLRIKTIHSSLLIEGNGLSEDEVFAILDGKKVLGRTSDIREVENAGRAYDLIDQLDPFKLDDLLRAHGIMMNGLVEDAGTFRSSNAGVFDGERLIHAGTPASYIPEIMHDLFAWLADTDLHPLIYSCIFHYEFEFIHPFADGNGRTGRLWHTLMLSRWRSILAWLPIESVIRDRQQGYYSAIAESNATGSCEAFVMFMLKVIRDSMLPYLEQENGQESREEKILGLLTTRPNLTVSTIVQETGLPRRTVERILATLKGSNRLIRHGSPRAGRWEVVDDGN